MHERLKANWDGVEARIGNAAHKSGRRRGEIRLIAVTKTATLRDKHDERRRALGQSALRTLGELGYARSSLREIAQNSEFSHGVVHYYFDDKLDLIVYCVRQYKETCVRRYDGVVADSMTADERARPEIIGGSRKRRIARGSGTTPADINQVLNQFRQM